MDLRVSVSGRGAFYVRRSGTVRSRGAHRRENAGVSSETWVRIPRTENPRFPEEGSSALGKSGPKARPKGVVDGQQVEIPVPCIIRTVGTQKDNTSREWEYRGKRGRSTVGKSAVQSEDVTRSELK